MHFIFHYIFSYGVYECVFQYLILRGILLHLGEHAIFVIRNMQIVA